MEVSIDFILKKLLYILKMAAIFDMTRRVTMHDVDDQNVKAFIEDYDQNANAPPQQKIFEQRSSFRVEFENLSIINKFF